MSFVRFSLPFMIQFKTVVADGFLATESAYEVVCVAQPTATQPLLVLVASQPGRPGVLRPPLGARLQPAFPVWLAHSVSPCPLPVLAVLQLSIFHSSPVLTGMPWKPPPVAGPLMRQWVPAAAARDLPSIKSSARTARLL